ncbi:MAG: GNAT family N-acetyltransferase, partial [Planctomycetota bacterium]
MLRKLTESDRKPVLAYLTQEPSYNVFTIGDIENFGFETDFQDVWGECDEEGRYRAVVLRYFTNHIVYSAGSEFDREAVCGLLRSAQGGWMLSGKQSIVESLAPELHLGKVQVQTLL